MKDACLPFLASLFSAICLAPSVSFGQTRDLSAYKRQLENHIRNAECDDAGRVAKGAASEYGDFDELPYWYYQVIECDKGDWREYGLLIANYFDRQITVIVQQEDCRRADEFVDQIDNRFKQLQSQTSHARWLFRVAGCYEKSDPKKSLQLYRTLIAQFADTTAAAEARSRMNWLMGDRAWIFSDRKTVVEGVKSALRKRDVKQLERYASRSRFYYGFEESVRPASFDEPLRRFFANTFERYGPIIGTLECRDEARCLLPVELTQEEYPYWSFMFERHDGGWQWTGIVISGRRSEDRR